MGVTYIVVLDDSSVDSFCERKEDLQYYVIRYWKPIQLKYKDKNHIQFIFTTDPSKAKARYKNTFTTPWYLVPSYAAMMAIEMGKYSTPKDLESHMIMYDMRQLHVDDSMVMES